MRLAEEVGAVDILVNNAGFSWLGPSQELGAETLSELFVRKVESAYLLVAGLAPGMAQRGTGSIINLGSISGIIGLGGGAAHGAPRLRSAR